MANDNTDDLIISISTDQATLRRSIKRIESDLGTLAGTVKKQFDNVGRTVDNSVQSSLQNRINAMVGIGTKGAKEWTGALADQGKELERLRARYSPLFNTINNYKSAVAEIRQAHALGAISSNEMAAAISRERQAALAATAAIKGRNAAMSDTPNVRGNGSQSFNTSNLAAQGFDVAATAAFMPWYTVALQQGPQVAQVFNDIRGSGAAIGPAVAGAFMQIVNPVSLVTIGVIGATAALIQYLSSSGDVKKADEILKGHAETIATLKARYGEAAEGLREYVNEGMSGTAVDIRGRLKDAYKAVTDEISAKSTYSTFIQPYVGSTDAKIVADYRNAFIELRASVRDGKPDIISFREEMARIADNEEVPKKVRELAEEMRKVDPEVLKVARSIPGMVDQLALIEGTADRQAIAIGRLSGALRELSQIGLPNLSEIERVEDAYIKAKSAASNPQERYEADLARQDALRRIDNQNPTVINSDGNTTSVPIPGQKPVTLGDKPTKASRGSTRATASDRFTADIQSLRDRSAAIQQEMQLIGLSNQQQVERRTALDLEQSALRDLREEARRKGQTDLDSIKLSPEKVATIQAEAAAYAKQAEALRIAQEQQQNLVEWNGTARNATRGFIDDLISGEGAAKAFANGLSKIGDALLDDVLDAIFKVNGAAGGSGGLIGQLFGSIFGGGGGDLSKYSGMVGLFADGGYTGPGGKNDPAGVVHKGEVVFSKQDVARNGGVAATEALRLKGSPTLIVPTAPALSRGNLSGNVTTPIAINIDATGADSAGLARVERQLARLQAELPATVVKTVQNAQGRRAL
ncbi:phage tail length tape measure family protein [Endobacterium cereale]|uniref:phage tail length tape measure family protein n=1 Tax=Endobacterium cereale TaxID=2663029 RepID=UPI002B4A9E37|nr:phage tail length tape measure family protein [Endobacterium cereale]MEB2845931.1 phage tail length tape measure family protein [Endobacterium cereale]